MMCKKSIVFKMTLSLTTLLSTFRGIRGNVYDCWDPDKLNRMTFGGQNNKPDPGLTQFSKMVKCLAQENAQGGGQAMFGSGGQDNTWQPWGQNMANGNFVPNWNMNNKNNMNRNNLNNNNNQYSNNPYNNNNNRGIQQPNNWNNNNNRQNMKNPFPGNPNPPPGPNAGMPLPPQRGRNNDDFEDPNNNWMKTGNQPRQPQPGVHPDDWGRASGGGSSIIRDPINRGPGYRDSTFRDPMNNPMNIPIDPYNNNNNQKLDPYDPSHSGRITQGGLNAQYGDGAVVHGGGTSPDYVMLENEGELNALGISRKYGYILMALSVIVLAVLMVATIFCCNSSNSTMSQAANQNAVPAMLPGQTGIGGVPYDNYSIYSYKGLDTLRSGTLGTETMKSTRSVRPHSPQYRVSDIDPDYMRRFEA